ncbi:LOW QUALITY PROTEIN: glutathione hydrolase-like YwrD proenzyme [Macrochelys suwanniensis]
MDSTLQTCEAGTCHTRVEPCGPARLEFAPAVQLLQGKGQEATKESIGYSCAVLSRAGNVIGKSTITAYILKNGGNTVDAAVAIAAALNVTELCSTGVGGACFCLYYDVNTKQVQDLSGSGRSPGALTTELLRESFNETKPLPPFNAHNITVPSTTASWGKAVFLYGNKKFPGYMLQLFQELAKSDKKRFYEGCVAEVIIETVQRNGGLMDLEDLKSHVTDEIKPIFTNYKDVNVWGIPPNGQEITALIVLHILDNFNIKDMGHNTADYLHVLIKGLKLSFSVTFWFCADRDKVPVPTKELLSKTYAKGCLELINLQRKVFFLRLLLWIISVGKRVSVRLGIVLKLSTVSKFKRTVTKTGASDKHNKGNLLPVGSDTVYFTVVDAQSNACSFIISNSMGFDIGLEPVGFVFVFLNRGSNFSLSPSHLNCLATRKRPYHMIIPALATAADTGDLLCSFGVMGGFMQPQGHVQDVSALEIEREYKLKERKNELPKVP